MARNSKPILIAVCILHLLNPSPGDVLPIYRHQTQADPTQREATKTEKVQPARLCPR